MDVLDNPYETKYTDTIRSMIIYKILYENDRQNKVDIIVHKTRFALELVQKESPQAKVDQIVAELAIV